VQKPLGKIVDQFDNQRLLGCQNGELTFSDWLDAAPELLEFLAKHQDMREEQIKDDSNEDQVNQED
jgi:hypothetical protein